MKKSVVSLFVLFISMHPAAQQKHTLSGTVRNKKTGESIIGATINVVNQRRTVTSNEYGFYSLTLLKGSYQLEISL